MRILLVEDEAGMVDALTAALRRHGIALDHAGTLAAARSLADSGQHDAVLLDRRLPDGDGLELLVRLRARQEGVPVIVMTAVGELADKVGGLNAGADDYLVKPFAFDELLARLRAVLRRPVLMQPDVVRLGGLAFDLTHSEASVAGQRLELPRRELLVLEALVRRACRTVVRAALESAVFSLDDDIQSNALDTHVSRLRRKLEQASAGVEICGIRGVGYLLRALPPQAAAS
ncbi:response regulator transcription factor [Achromobacter xylosoxidans]